MIAVIKAFSDYGFHLVQLPVFEFEQVLFGESTLPSEMDAFRVHDPISYKMLGVRSDMTTQIARVVRSRMHDQPVPLRLCYCGEVYRIKPYGKYHERQLTQAGVERVGEHSAEALKEIFIVLRHALNKLKIKDICVDFTIPELVDCLMDEFRIKRNNRDALKQACQKKDIAVIRSLVDKKTDVFEALVKPDCSLETLQSLKLPPKSRMLVQKLADVLQSVEGGVENVTFTIDPLEAFSAEYHTGIAFSVFAGDISEEIGRGGFYLINGEDGSLLHATGLSFYLDELLRKHHIATPHEKVLVPISTPLESIASLHEKGYITVFATDNSDIAVQAKTHQCDFYLSGTHLEKPE